MTPADAASWIAAPPPRSPVGAGARPTFSVVIAAWQSAATIAGAVRSVVEQSEPPIEIVVCDDESTDDPWGALAPFADQISFLRIAHGGVSRARNAAADRTTGEFIVILDADDTWAPRRLERLGDAVAARPDLDLITTDGWFVVDGVRRGTFYGANEFPTHDQVSAILQRNFVFQHAAVRRSRWLEHGGFSPDLDRGEDWDFWLRLLLDGSVAGCVLEPLADYLIHDTSLSADRYRSLMARVTVLDRAEAAHALSAEQRARLASARAGYLRRALAARAEQLLTDEAPGRRRASLALLRAAGTWRTRLHAAAAAVAPGSAGARLRRIEAELGRAPRDRTFAAGESSRSAAPGDHE